MEDVKSQYGKSYRMMMAEVNDVVNNYGTLFPALKKHKQVEVVGFLWFQGWNDQYGGQDEYASNLKHFIGDVRKDLGAPKLPFVIGVMGQNGSKPAGGAMLAIQKAQLAMNDIPSSRATSRRSAPTCSSIRPPRNFIPPGGRTRAMETRRRRLWLPLPRQRDLVQPHRQGDG